MLRFAATDRATKGADTTSVDADTSTLRHITDDSAGGSVDRI